MYWQLFAYHLHCIHIYLHDIYFVLGIISNLEMIQSIREDIAVKWNALLLT